jgi:hypothetical protein
MRLGAPALIAPEAREAGRGTQLERAGFLSAPDLERSAKASFGLRLGIDAPP